jgi:CheY-like chemotaxis protein
MAKRILVVDDEPGTVKVLALLLRKWGFEVETAVDGAEAIKVLERVPLAGMITDIIMPRMTGVEALRQLRQANPSLPVLVISGTYHQLKESDLEFLRNNAQALLPKPIGPDELKQVVDQWFGLPPLPPCDP